jgi:hypothetical protein
MPAVRLSHTSPEQRNDIQRGKAPDGFAFARASQASLNSQ